MRLKASRLRPCELAFAFVSARDAHRRTCRDANSAERRVSLSGGRDTRLRRHMARRIKRPTIDEEIYNSRQRDSVARSLFGRVDLAARRAAQQGFRLHSHVESRIAFAFGRFIFSSLQ